MAKRFVTYFGVSVPPFKEEKLGAGSKTIRFVIAGNVISKKNIKYDECCAKYNLIAFSLFILIVIVCLIIYESRKH